MLNNRYFLFTAASLIVLLGVVFVLRGGSGENIVQSSVAKPQEKVITKNLSESRRKVLKEQEGDMSLGSRNAPVLMIEYASLSCPHCADFAQNVLPRLEEAYINKGRLRYVFRDFPHTEPGFRAALLAHCGGEDKFFGFVKVLFGSQDKWALSDKSAVILANIAKLGGIEQKQFDECMANKALEEKVLKSKSDGINVLGIEGVPAIFINGNLYDGGKDFESVGKFIESQLKGGARDEGTGGSGSVKE